MQKQIVSTQIQHLEAETILLEFASLKDAIRKLSERVAPPASADEYLTRDEVAALLKISKVTVWQWSKKEVGILFPRYIGNKVRYLKSEVLDAAKATGREVRQ